MTEVDRARVKHVSSEKVRFESLAATLGFQLRRASYAIETAYELAFEPLGLRTSDAKVLIGIGENPGRNQADLARNLKIAQANLVPIIAKLISRSIVVRNAGKGRAVSLFLTATGEELLTQVRKALLSEESVIESLIAEKDRPIIMAALKAIAQTACRERTP
jgi:DNA-binding MarR family transcriptional regulator